MNLFDNIYFSITSAFILAFLFTLLIIPLIIKYSRKYNLIDTPDVGTPDARKMHKEPVPTMGGVGIFIGFILSTSAWTILHFDPLIVAMVAGLMVLFVMGMLDDRLDLSAKTKFLVQFAVAIMIAYFGLRITSLNGFFNIYELPEWVQFAFTVFLVVGLTNAFNLIDGIDGLAGGLAFINSVVLGILLILNHNLFFSVVAFGFAGALLGFLKFNFNPAKIFMGDTGSLVIGFMMATLGIMAILGPQDADQQNLSGLTIIVFGTMLVPVYDTLRVFSTRILSGKSPFKADKTHVHHILIEIEEEKNSFDKSQALASKINADGIKAQVNHEKQTLIGWVKRKVFNTNHKKAAISLYVADIIIIGTAFLLQNQNPTLSMTVLILLLVVLMSNRLFGKGMALFTKEKQKAEMESGKLVEENRFLNRTDDEMGVF